LFFFSSRRRHTRCYRDWSSDVCSSDLKLSVSRVLSRLLLAGKGPRAILDVLQIGAAQVLLETRDTLNFSTPQHCYEYCNTLGWFYDTFDHPQRLKLLYCAAAFLNRNAFSQRAIGAAQPFAADVPAGADRLA